jgi:AcrR family transcriptional regulator
MTKARPSTKIKASTKAPSNSDRVDTRSLLVATAKRIFAAKTFDGTTVKDIADGAGVNISLVSYHFGGKENLYRHCLESFADQPLKLAERVLKAPKTLDEFRFAIQIFVHEMIGMHRDEPELCTIIHRDIAAANEIALDVFKRVFLGVYQMFREFIIAAQRAGVIRKNIPSEMLCSILFGSMIHFATGDHLRKIASQPSLQDKKFVNLFVESYLTIFFDGMVNKTGSSK